MKLEATSNLICIKKERRAGSSYAPGVVPRIMQETIHQPCQKWDKFPRALPEEQLVCTILRLYLPKKSHSSWHQRVGLLLSAETYAYNVEVSNTTKAKPDTMQKQKFHLNVLLKSF